MPALHPEKGTKKILETVELPEIYIDSNKTVWATTGEGLYQFDNNLQYQKIDSIGIAPFAYYDQFYTHYFVMKTDRRGTLWAAIGNRLYQLDNQTKKVIRTYIGPKPMHITNFFFDSENHCWISSWGDGILEFIQDKELFQHIDLAVEDMHGDAILEWTLNKKEVHCNRHKFLCIYTT